MESATAGGLAPGADRVPVHSALGGHRSDADVSEVLAHYGQRCEEGADLATAAALGGYSTVAWVSFPLLVLWGPTRILALLLGVFFLGV